MILTVLRMVRGCTCLCRWCRDGRHEYCDSGCKG